MPGATSQRPFSLAWGPRRESASSAREGEQVLPALDAVVVHGRLCSVGNQRTQTGGRGRGLPSVSTGAAVALLAAAHVASSGCGRDE